MSTILDNAEARVTDVKTNAQSTQAQQVEAMRDEIGRQAYEQAKAMLPKLDTAIQKTYRPFLDRVAHLETRSNAPLPTHVKAWLAEIAKLCDGVPRTIRAGIEGWDGLIPPIWKDGKSLDMSVRGQLVHDIRFSLKNWDGVHSRLDNLKTQTETYIQESGWPTKQAGMGA